LKDEVRVATSESKASKNVAQSLRRELDEHQMAQQQAEQKKMTHFVKKSFGDGVYIGEVNEQGQKHGRGSLWKKNNYFYFGDWKEDQKSGQGVEYTRSQIYEGKWLGDERNGRGAVHYVYDSPTEYYISVYNGEWKSGKRSGKGSAVYLDNSTYEGEWEDDKRSGQGVDKYSDGDEYVGKLEKGKKNGYGIFRFANGDRYEGEWRDNRRTGQGVYKYSDGDEYVGHFENGKKDGYGTFRWANGDRYEGNFQDDLFEGKGTSISVRNGYTFDGEYSKDRRIRGVIKWDNGDVWEGHYLPNEAQSTEGRLTSEGAMTFAETGNRLTGRWAPDYTMKNGKGTMTMWVKSENREVKGEWVEGVFVETATIETQ